MSLSTPYNLKALYKTHKTNTDTKFQFSILLGLPRQIRPEILSGVADYYLMFFDFIDSAIPSREEEDGVQSNNLCALEISTLIGLSS